MKTIKQLKSKQFVFTEYTGYEDFQLTNFVNSNKIKKEDIVTIVSHERCLILFYYEDLQI